MPNIDFDIHYFENQSKKSLTMGSNLNGDVGNVHFNTHSFNGDQANFNFYQYNLNNKTKYHLAKRNFNQSAFIANQTAFISNQRRHSSNQQRANMNQ